MESGALAAEWLPAYTAVPREKFVPTVFWPGKGGGRQGRAIDRSREPDAWREVVYSDRSLTTQYDDGAHTAPEPGSSPSSSNSQPTLVFSMLAALDVAEGHKVLEIGTGTGWNTALLCERLGSDHVFTVEVDTDTARKARQALSREGYTPTTVVGDGADGYVPAAPYDRVEFTASVRTLPQAVIRQTRPGGMILAPYAPTYGGGAIVRLTVDAEGVASGPFVGSAAFMRLRQQRSERLHTREYLGGKDWPAGGERSVTALSPEDVGDWLPMFAVGMRTSGMFPWAERYGDTGAYTLWLRDEAVSSWATVDYDPGASEFVVYQDGPRKLWDELEAAFRWWAGRGRPGYARFGLTVTPDGRHTPWLDSPHNPVQLTDDE
ncbi:methyltransferase domain-containing protein [Streptomyces sp. SB3404]|uniref:Protein-L-isoaspartate O-methyltransferase n=1 Tax=Streptomyces boncukensis TaxID=2711219 RepID=A0A6G4WRI4_9ACTN|nr:methyltransferase domain-containing protein [Streptomyces boncukensis]